MHDLLEYIQQIAIITTSLVTLASTITAVTDTPSDDNLKGKIYKIIEFLALVNDRTKQR